jgi:hypothetical protein
MKSTALTQSYLPRWWSLAAMFGMFSVLSATVVVWLWMVMFALQWASPHIAPAAS